MPRFDDATHEEHRARLRVVNDEEGGAIEQKGLRGRADDDARDGIRERGRVNPSFVHHELRFLHR